MLDAVLIQQCADPSLKPAIVEQFIAKAGSQDPLAITVRSGNRLVLVQKPTTPEEALALIRDNLGRNTVRVGITQYPAGLGIVEAGQLKREMVEPCENIRLGRRCLPRSFASFRNGMAIPPRKTSCLRSWMMRSSPGRRGISKG